MKCSVRHCLTLWSLRNLRNEYSFVCTAQVTGWLAPFFKLQHGCNIRNNLNDKIMIYEQCTKMCPEYGYCNNRCPGKECEGFIPMDSDEEEHDPMEEKIERSTY